MKILDVPQSGSTAGTTSSRNRYGQYRRTRAIPVNRRTTSQGAVRANMALNAAAWRLLTDAQRSGWEDLGTSITRTDALGQSYQLNGFGAYCSVNNSLATAGMTLLSDAPGAGAALALLTATVTTTGGTLSIAYTATPLPALTKLLVFASPQRSAGRAFEGDLRLIHVSAAAAVSPANVLAGYTAKWGVPIVGKKIFFSLIVSAAGQPSGPLMLSKVVTA